MSTPCPPPQDNTPTPTQASPTFLRPLSKFFSMSWSGGSGTRALFAVWDEAQTEQHKKWKERPVGWIAQYAGQMVMLYLGVVLMWDAKYGYIFTSRKEPMPDDCMIDDNFFAEGGTGEDADE